MLVKALGDLTPRFADALSQIDANMQAIAALKQSARTVHAAHCPPCTQEELSAVAEALGLSPAEQSETG